MGEQGNIAVAAAAANIVGHADTAGNLVAAIQQQLGGRRADLCVLFASAHFEDELERIVDAIQEQLRPRALIGNTADAVIAGEFEYEHQPAITLWAAHLPGAHVSSFHIYEEADLARLHDDATLREYIGVPPDAQPHFILIGEPYSFSGGTLALLDRLERAFPGRPALGGMASAADQPGQNVLIFDGQLLRHGLAGAALWGNVAIDAIVSQGCRPIGRHLVITKAEQNMILQLGGKAPWSVVNEILHECSDDDRRLLHSHGLLVGRVINEHRPQFSRGDFLIRNFLGFDQSTGAMAVNELVRAGQTIQFHVRDAGTASEDLQRLLATPRAAPPAGALLFSCNGRGTRFFSERNHDARWVSQAAGHIPVAGFFCAGEIGPVGARNFLHGFTASIGFLRSAAPVREFDAAHGR